MNRISFLARMAIGSAIASLTLASHAATAFDVTSFLFDVNGSASASFTTAAPVSGSFGPTNGVSGKDVASNVSFFDLGAGGSVTAAGYIRTGVDGSISPMKSTLTFSATSNAMWTGRFVNVLPTAQTFSLGVFGFNDLSFGGIPGDYAAHLFVGSTDYNLSGLYGDTATVSIGSLAPGQGVDLRMTSYSTANFKFGPESDGGGALSSMLGLVSYDATPVAAVPEPATYAMFAAGLIGILSLKRRRQPRA